MKIAFRALTLLCFVLVLSSQVHAQAMPAASRPLTLSVFGGANGTFTGLAGGKNVGITAGADLGFKPFHAFYPSVEVRGTYPFDDGHIDSQKNILVGPKVERYYGNFHPYVDFFWGRGKIDYLNGGFPNPSGTLLYLDSVSNVFAGGGGLDYTLTDHFAIKLDAQYQRYATPVTTSGSIYATPLTLGVVYRFGGPYPRKAEIQ
ncbi:MAG TPA: outer membrane beta-barrel protein [Acidobacteriaceae bacterium]|nr:outer membrane beta-barrel protein [Acidobacteriaceae bacterium]